MQRTQEDMELVVLSATYSLTMLLRHTDDTLGTSEEDHACAYFIPVENDWSSPNALIGKTIYWFKQDGLVSEAFFSSQMDLYTKVEQAAQKLHNSREGNWWQLHTMKHLEFSTALLQLLNPDEEYEVDWEDEDEE